MVRIARLDVDDDSQIEQFWRVSKASAEYGRDYPTFETLAGTTSWLRMTGAPFKRFQWLAWEGSDVRGTAVVGMPLLDNPHFSFVNVHVAPQYRRAGIGTALLDVALATCRDEGRTVATADVNVPVEGASGNLDFATHHGFAIGLENFHRVLDLPVEAGKLDQLDAEVAERADGYRLVSFDDRRPDDIVEGYAHLNSIFMAEAPVGDLDVEPEVWDVKRLRDMERNNRERGRAECGTVAVAPDGEVVALTEISIDLDQPAVAFQSGTLVGPGHRGHRLGLAIKVANLRVTQARFPELRVMHSWNADVNEHMIAINDMLGFRVVERMSELQRTL